LEGSNGAFQERAIEMNMEALIIELNEISKKKVDCVQDLLRLTTIQKILIKNGDIERLSEFIDQKQAVMEQIHNLDIVFLEHYNQLKKNLKINTFEDVDVVRYPAVKELRKYIQRIMELLKQIGDLDSQNKENLRLDLDKIKDEMKTLKAHQQGAKITSSYKSKYVGGQGVFIDNKDK